MKTSNALAKTSLLAGLTVLASMIAYSAGDHDHDHGHDDDHEEEPRGPQGGRLLVDGDFSVELTVFESGIPPEF